MTGWTEAHSGSVPASGLDLPGREHRFLNPFQPDDSGAPLQRSHEQPAAATAGLLGGRQAPLDLGLMLQKRLSLVGTTLRARPIEEKIAVIRLFASQVLPWLEKGLVRPVVDSMFPFEEVKAAQTRLESNEGLGKVILQL